MNEISIERVVLTAILAGSLIGFAMGCIRERFFRREFLKSNFDEIKERNENEKKKLQPKQLTVDALIDRLKQLREKYTGDCKIFVLRDQDSDLEKIGDFWKVTDVDIIDPGGDSIPVINFGSDCATEMKWKPFKRSKK